MDKHDTVGLDLVAMVVDDLVVCGAEPLFLQDYIAVGRVVPEQVAELVAGIAEGCVRAGCALLGGETAEHPGLMGRRDYDLSATGVGVVEAEAVLGPDRVRPGDVRHRDRVVGAALQRLLPRAQGPARHRPDETRRARRGVRSHPRRRTARADPDLREGLPRPRRGDGRAHVRTRHRRWVGRQPGPRHAEGSRGRTRPRHLESRAGVQDDRSARPGGAGRDGAAPSTWEWAWSPSSPRRTSTAHSPF